MAQDDALERKLRPIFDALDARNYKASVFSPRICACTGRTPTRQADDRPRLPQGALKLADAALSKKYRQEQMLRSLRAFALAKLGRTEEGEQVRHDGSLSAAEHSPPLES